MQCNDIREFLSAHLDGVLEPSDHDLVDAHLASCTVCAQELEDLQMVVELLHDLPEISPPPGFRPELRKRIEALAPPQPVKRSGLLGYLTRKGVARMLAVAATVLIIAGVTAALYGNPGQWGQKGVGHKDEILAGKNVARLNKENAAGVYDVQKDTSDGTVGVDSQRLRSNFRDQVVTEQQNDADMNTREDNLKIADAYNKSTPGDGMPEVEKLNSISAVPDGAGSIRPESSDAPQAFDAGKGMSSPQAKMYSLQAEPRKTLKQAEMSMATDNPDQAAEKVSGLARSRGGQVEPAGSPGEQVLILRLPVDNFNVTIDDLGKMGAGDKKVTEKDVTSEYANTVDSLTDLEKREEALSPADVQAKNALTREINAKRDQVRDLEESVNNAIIKIKIFKKQ